MADNSLPDVLRRGLIELASLSDAAFDRFLNALRAIPVAIARPSIFPDLDIPDFPGDVNLLQGTAYSLIMSRMQRSESISESAHAIVQDFNTDGGLGDINADFLKTRIQTILGVDTLNIIAKSQDILTEHDSAYISARVMSDVRAVFGDDINLTPPAAVIIHMLNISLLDSGRRRTSVIALDEGDVEQLIEVLERARKKAETLKKFIENSGMKHVGVV